MTDTRIELTARAKAYSHQGVRTHRFYVDLSDGDVRVWDPVYGGYTNCNCLTDAAKERILRLARNRK